jgi:hypothetical protein
MNKIQIKEEEKRKESLILTDDILEKLSENIVFDLDLSFDF